MPSCGTNRRSAVLTYALLLACTSSGAGCLDRNAAAFFLSLLDLLFFSKSWTPSFATKKLTKIVAIVSHR